MEHLRPTIRPNSTGGLMATPARRFTIYGTRGLYRASVNTVQLATIAVAALGKGATIRERHSVIVWAEGEEICSATDARAVAIIEGRSTTARVMREEASKDAEGVSFPAGLGDEIEGA